VIAVEDLTQQDCGTLKKKVKQPPT
jgi:hypothetical protein